MTAEYREKGDVLIVIPSERLDTSSAPGVEQEVVSRIDAGTVKIVFDFERTKYVSSAGLRVVLKAAKAVGKKGGGVAVCRANSHVKEVFELSGFQMVVKMEKTLDKAMAVI